MSRTSIMSLVVVLFALPGCTGEFVDPSEQVARIELRIDNLGALLSTECVSLHGESGCSRYPNPLECESMTIRIRGDGRTCAVCRKGDQRPAEVCGGVSDGIPILCQTTPELSCHVCTDVYGNSVLDTCSSNSGLYRAGGWSKNPGQQLLDDGTGTLGDGSQGAGQDGCDSSQARLAFADAMNQIMATEGLGLTYSPDLGQQYNTTKGYWGYKGQGSNKGDMCKHWLNSDSMLTKCSSNEPGKCYCECQQGSQDQVCRCARITVAALRAVCDTIPPECDYDSWVAAFVMEYGVATNWLFSSSYKNAGYYGGLPSSPQPLSGATGGTDGGTITPPGCLGSPLVLDLGGDGIQPTSVEDGVSFDLLGHGVMRTAWVSDDDALLVLDRNNNGAIDDGTELFGSATDIGGAPAVDGFQALAVLDRPSEGGNGNGRLDPDDLMFGALRLWNDADRNGASRAEELRSLSQAGIRTIGVSGEQVFGAAIDRHGNDLSLRGSFTHAGGVGLMVDVLFRVER